MDFRELAVNWANMINESTMTHFSVDSDPGSIKINLGIYVNQGKMHWLDLILSGKKTIETRPLSIGQRINRILSMSGNIEGQRIALISGGMIVAIAPVKEIKFYRNDRDFFEDSDKHFITHEIAEYGYDQIRGKSGIVFESKIIKLQHPVALSPEKRQRQMGYIILDDREKGEIIAQL